MILQWLRTLLGPPPTSSSPTLSPWMIRGDMAVATPLATCRSGAERL